MKESIKSDFDQDRKSTYSKVTFFSKADVKKFLL